MLVGELLKKKREESGRDLKEIAETLKIRLDYLKALEEGDLKKLPAEVYLKGYLIEYAKILDLDPEMVMDTYHKEASPPSAGKEQLQEILPMNQKRKPLGYLLIAGAVIALIVLIAMVWSPGDEKKTGVAPTVMTEVPHTKQAADASRPQPEKTTAIEPAQNDTAVAGTPSSPEQEQYDLKIIADDTTWLSVTIDDADPEEMLLNAGESVTRHALESFGLKIGNAGGIRILLNGKEIPPLGKEGQVVNITLPGEAT